MLSSNNFIFGCINLTTSHEYNFLTGHRLVFSLSTVSNVCQKEMKRCLVCEKKSIVEVSFFL